MIIPYDSLLNLILNNSEIHNYIKITYPSKYEYFDRFRKRNGNNCRFVRAYLKEIYLLDKQVNGQLYTSLG